MRAALTPRRVLFGERGEADKGIADLTEVILRLNPVVFTMLASWRRGDAFLKKGEYERAIADYKEEINNT